MVCALDLLQSTATIALAVEPVRPFRAVQSGRHLGALAHPFEWSQHQRALSLFFAADLWSFCSTYFLSRPAWALHGSLNDGFSSLTGQTYCDIFDLAIAVGPGARILLLSWTRVSHSAGHVL